MYWYYNQVNKNHIDYSYYKNRLCYHRDKTVNPSLLLDSLQLEKLPIVMSRQNKDAVLLSTIHKTKEVAQAIAHKLHKWYCTIINKSVKLIHLMK